MADSEPPVGEKTVQQKQPPRNLQVCLNIDNDDFIHHQLQGHIRGLMVHPLSDFTRFVHSKDETLAARRLNNLCEHTAIAGSRHCR